MIYFRLLYFAAFTFLFSHFVQAQTFEQYIQASNDDAEEKHDGSYVTTSSSDLELMYDSWNDQELQTVGLRFNDVTIPANSNITNAYIQFTADGDYSGNMTITIHGEDVANSLAFSGSSNNISARSTTSTNVTWSSIPDWTDGQSGTAQRTPNLSSIVSEIISSNGWQNGNALTFILTGTGNSSQKRRAYSFDEDPGKSAKLVIEYASQSDVDLALSATPLPTSVNFPNATAQVQVEITSFGNLPASSYSVSYSINNSLIATEPGTTSLSVGQSTLFTFSQTADLSSLGSYDLDFEVNITNDEDLSNNTLSKTITVVNEIDPLLFSQGSPWRYWDNSAAPASTWNTVNFDDASWFVGDGHFGFGDGDEQTELNDGLASYYFRKKVVVQDVNQLNEVYMHMVHDDAAIVFINGQEVLRSELMKLGLYNHYSYARQENNDNTENDFYTYKIDPSYFVNGENTIAISIRNESASDEDVSFDCFMTSNFSYDQDGPYVYYSGNDIIVEEVTPNGLVSNTYTSTAGLQLTCTLPHMNTSFSFPLKSQITNEASEYPNTPPKFLTISDFDGHIEAFTMILKGEGIIDDNFNWTYGDGHLIISGDLFDRGFHITECMWLLYKLEDEAAAQGGKVHLIIGNHEMFNLTDDWRYVEVKYFNSAHLMGKRMSELYGADTELGRWLRSKNILERIGDYAFMHGGLSPEVSALNLSFDEINAYGRMEMNNTACPNNDCDVVNGSDGVYWYRGMADEDLTQQEVDDIVSGFGVERVIIGHTKDNTVRALYDGRVIAIDMYHMDNFSNGFMEALQFELGCFYIFNTTGSNETYTLLDNCDDYVGNNEIDKSTQLQIYPNPTASILNIKLPVDLVDAYEYTVVDEQGKVVKSGQFNSASAFFEVASFKAGKYHLTLKSATKTITGHFILRQK